MTLEELQNQEPELVQQIRAQAHDEAVSAAITSERERLRGISEIAAAVGDQDMINEAMYGEKACTASELALRVMQRDAQK